MERKEALEVVRKNMPTDRSLPVYEALQTLIPELRESEDERIRAVILKLVLGMRDEIFTTADKLVTKPKVLAWLEKQKEHQFCSDAPKGKNVGGNFSSSHKDKNLDEIAQDYIDGVKEYNPEPTWDLMQTAVCYGYHYREQKEQKPASAEDMPYITDEHFFEREPKDSFKYKLAEYMTKCCTKKEGPYGYTYGISAETILEMAKEELIKRGVVQKPAEWKPQPESLEALMYAVEGKWEMIKPTSYLSRRLEDLYDGLVNTYNVDELPLAELPKTVYTAKDIEEIRALKDKIDASMESSASKPEDRFAEAREKYQVEWSEEDEKMLTGIIERGSSQVPFGEPALRGEQMEWLMNMLKSHRLQPKQEWSEEEKQKLNRIYEILGYAADDKGFLTSKRIIGDKEAIELQDFLKSLRPSWKPSEEQMEALEECGECKRCIKELYEQLKKLM